ncbi:sulfide dehydrogenase (flavocytochrome c) flavoprotein chain [Luminiphilus syltensis NOR5-1B]|uniref:Sulfide dehydrogenase (Flavocytochrome c) flavoprotein chain n=1 Tax=Luminiphilus syltensis NOR5-1B TaxID=565045 RepID=B8KV97_9GAMM|nr:FAD/NAD(P)-binding oxidoreductase [Luminiphilus syltensis]EED35823.1 sulfide dehydrogenase (flavocytochrome c) flavoprotein chain [Luminiphilus syltensis NOR5-1B]
MTISRRNLIRTTSGVAALSLIGKLSSQIDDRHHVVVVGGGFAGSTLARYLSLWGEQKFRITLIDPSSEHSSCVMSNLVLTNQIALSKLTFSHTPLADRFNFATRVGSVSEIKAGAKSVLLADGSELSYDTLVLATGIELDAIDGYDPARIPHAWIAGDSTELLRQQLNEELPAGGHVVMTIPEAPYRCPPGPYERACLLAAMARQITDANGGSGVNGSPTVTVLDANEDIQAEKATFTAAFEELYGDIIDYRRGVKITRIDSDNRTAYTTVGAFSGDVLNVIPNHQAPAILRNAGLVPTGDRWAPVDPVTYESALIGGIYVIGDAQATSQPKSAHMANAQAKVCADAIIRKTAGLATHASERINNLTTNSACFSPVNFNEAAWLTAVFRYNTASRLMELAPNSLGASEGWDRESYDDMYTWASNLFSDTFV